MKIGLNATCLSDRPSGAKQRFLGIYKELVKSLPAAEFVVYEPSDCHVGSWFDGAGNVSVRRAPVASVGRAQRFFRGIGYWGRALRMEKFDIFEGLNLPLVTSPVGVNIFTIHDIRGIGVASSILERYSFEFALRSAFERADHIVTVSETMKRAILDLYPDLSVSVIYNGLPDRAYERVSSEQLESVRLKYSIAGDFILAVGHLERRKNYGRLISAFARLRESDFDVSLVIIGNDSGELSAIRDVIDVEGVRDRVIILGGLSDFDVHCIYRLCKLFVFPSLYEGFGIPILEAMAAGCPMVLSDIPVFREITQSQGVYFDPLNVDSMVLCMETVLASDLVRSCVIEYGDRRVQEFSYAGLAVQLKDIYLGLI